MSHEPVHVGVEVGGTKVVVASSVDGPHLATRETIETTDPSDTLGAVTEAIERIAGKAHIRALGIASFGPIDLRTGTQGFGTMLATPKPGWTGVDVLRHLARSDCPIAIDTDVNAALIAEQMWGSGTAEHVMYMTVGTGIGAGISTGGNLVHGANHPEIGHIRVPRHPHDDFVGTCPFHGDCLEGMASGPSIRQRWGVGGDELGSALEAATDMEAFYLAQGIASVCCVVPLEQVIIGGGVANLPGLHEAIAAGLGSASGGYPAVPFTEHGPAILRPGLGDDAGVVGAIELARAL